MDLKPNLDLQSVTSSALRKKIPQIKGVKQADKTDLQRDNQFNKRLKEATKSFEELFVHNLIKEMRKSIPKEGLLSGGQGEEIFQDMLDGEFAKKISENQGIGLSEFMYQQLKQ